MRVEGVRLRVESVGLRVFTISIVEAASREFPVEFEREERFACLLGRVCVRV